MERCNVAMRCVFGLLFAALFSFFLVACGGSDETQPAGMPPEVTVTDTCPKDPLKTAPGVCGCGISDTDTDGDGTADCNDPCPQDPEKIAPGECGFGGPDVSSWEDWANRVIRKRDDALLHEWGHQIGLLDLYRMDIQDSQCLISVDEPEAEGFSNSSAGQGIDRLFDGQDGAIPTYEDKEVYFALQFREPRAINRMRIKFSHSNHNQWEAWGGERPLSDRRYAVRDLLLVHNCMCNVTVRGLTPNAWKYFTMASNFY